MIVKITMEYDLPCFRPRPNQTAEQISEGLQAANEHIRQMVFRGEFPTMAGQSIPARVTVETLDGTGAGRE